MSKLTHIENHLRLLSACERCPRMHKPVVVGRAVSSQVLLIGQAPGDKEPLMGRPFAWTAGKTLFTWFERALGWTEEEVRNRIYFAAVCRCFPGKKEQGGDRVPAPVEIEACASWLEKEVSLLETELVIPVGKLAYLQVLGERPMNETIGREYQVEFHGRKMACIPLPHPSGASPWHRMEPGKTLLNRALEALGRHEAIRRLGEVRPPRAPEQMGLTLADTNAEQDALSQKRGLRLRGK